MDNITLALNDPATLKGFCIALILLAAVFALIAFDEIQQHRKTRAKFVAVKALWDSRMDLEDRIRTLRALKPRPAVSATDAQRVQQRIADDAWKEMTQYGMADPRD